MSLEQCKSFWIKVLSALPVVLTLLLIGWSYYVYVVLICIVVIQNLIQKIIYIVIYNYFLFMLLWCYFLTILCKIPPVPKEFYLTEEELEKLFENAGDKTSLLHEMAKTRPVHSRTAFGGIRYCTICQCIKPDRAHHCSSCKRCILKMDHHCVWMYACLGFHNYKFFVLFLGYTFLFSIYIALSDIQFVLLFFKRFVHNEATSTDIQCLVLFIVAVVMAVHMCILLVYHCKLISQNKTTLESFRPVILDTGTDKDAYNLGRHENFCAVFGRKKRFWFFPVFTSEGEGDGILFPCREKKPLPSYQSFTSTASGTMTTSYPQPKGGENEYLRSLSPPSEDTDRLLQDS